jgi:hydroxymethylbilane synthase
VSDRLVSVKSGSNPIRIATRASRLALWQAEHVASLLRSAAADRTVDLVHVATSGDEDRTRPLSEMGGVGVFTREVQRAVLDGRADAAVHSLKDLPTETLSELRLAGIPARAPRCDVLVLPGGARIDGLDQLPAARRIGTGSLRRRAQLLHIRPELVMCDIRGNVETRLRKLDHGEYDALVLAEAGLERLGLSDRVSLVLQPPLMYPAVGQAAIGIECRADDAEVISLLDRISDPIARAETTAERACLAELRAGCHAPVGVWAAVSGTTLRLEAVVLSPDGRQRLTSAVSGDVSDPPSVGREIARDLFRQGAETLIQMPG